MSIKLKEIFADDPQMLDMLERRDANLLMKEIFKGQVAAELSTPLEHPVQVIRIEEKKGTLSGEEIQTIVDRVVPLVTPVENEETEKGIDEKAITKKIIKSVLAHVPTAEEVALKIKPSEYTPETPEEIVAKINSLEGSIKAEAIMGLPAIEEIIKAVIEVIKKDKLIELRDIKGARLDTPGKQKFDMNDQRWHGGGSSGGTSGLTLVTVTGTINDSNVTFTAASTPTVLVINGAFYQQTGGAITWSLAGLVITLSSPVGTGGSIFALK